MIKQCLMVGIAVAGVCIYSSWVSSRVSEKKLEQLENTQIVSENMQGESNTTESSIENDEANTGYEDLKVSEEQQEEIKAQMLELANTYKTIYNGSKQLSDKKIEQIIKFVGKQGYAVFDNQNKVNMENGETVEIFCEALKNGSQVKDAEVTFYQIGIEGDLNQINLRYTGEYLQLTIATAAWNEQHEAEVSYIGRFNAYYWEYTDNGYLICEKYVPNGYDGLYGSYAWRIKPLDSKCRAFTEECLKPITYNNNNLFLTDWSEDNMSEQLNFVDLYECLYRIYYKKWMSLDTFRGGIPKEEFEKVILTYFNSSSDKLEQIKGYDKANQKFLWYERTRAEISTHGTMPVPEVVAYKENADGTTTLTVNALWFEHHTDCAFTHELTIRQEADGRFKYVSNHIVPSDKNELPNYVPRNWE